MAVASHPIAKRNVVVVGKAGAGKSTVCNSILGYKKFAVSSGLDGVTKEVTHEEMEFSDSGVRYIFKVVDTIGLFDPTHAGRWKAANKDVLKSIKTYAREIIPEGVSIILFVFKEGRYTKEEKETFSTFFKKFGNDVSAISALVMTGCEQHDEDTRSKLKDAFRRNELTAEVAKFMYKGIHPVGFPDTSKMKEELEAFYKVGMETDSKSLRHLIMDSGEMRLSKEIFGEELWERLAKLSCF